jgi:hypothetical protein
MWGFVVRTTNIIIMIIIIIIIICCNQNPSLWTYCLESGLDC